MLGRGKCPPGKLPKTTLLSATFLGFVFGAMSNPDRMPVDPVYGMLGGSVLLVVRNVSTLEKRIKSTEWLFQPPNGSGLIIAEFGDGKGQRPNPRDRFGQRLDLVDEITLRIQNLEKEDSGDYKVRVKLHSATAEDYILLLRVYDPVPVPEVHQRGVSVSPTGCNVTLECCVSEKAGLNVSWQTGEALRPLGGNPDGPQISSQGWLLHLYLEPGSLDPNVTCLVANPADQKTASFDILSICSQQEGKARTHLWPLCFLIVPLASLSFWIWKKRWKPFHSRGDSSVPMEKDPNSQYLEVSRRRIPPEGENGQEPGISFEQSSPPETIYAKVQPHGPSS